MIKVFIPCSKGRVKTSVRGFWYSQDTKRAYYDYLKVVNTSCIGGRQLKDLKIKYNQECIAFIDTAINCLKIYHSKDKQECLQNRIYAEVQPQDLKKEIKTALQTYGGITIYKQGSHYFKEIFY